MRGKNQRRQRRGLTWLGRQSLGQESRGRTAARAARRNGLGFETLESRLAMAGLVINEFLAANTVGLQDEDGDRSDWIELKNTTAAPINLAGYHLTDDSADLDKWTLPAVSIPAGGHLVIFASGKDRTVVGQNLHTNFSLNEAGEYLALMQPGGVTVEDAYDPFPAQVENISYGRGASVLISENLVGESAPVRALVPNNTTSSVWYTTGFNDSTWLSGTGGVGFDTAPDYDPYISLDLQTPMFNVRASAYLRYAFTVANPAEVTSLLLRMRYDDGFAVYLNGTLIPAPTGQRNAPASLTFSSAATGSHADNLAILYEDFDLSAYKNLLVAGNNMLAIHGLNTAANNTDFLISPLLAATRPSAAVVGYMATPTPGAANTQGTLGVVADTSFSIDRGFFTSPFNVAITTTTPSTTIRYTTDGSLPTATTGTLYNPASPPLINKTTTLRAAAFRTGWTPTNVDTQTYIFLDNVIQQSGVGLPTYANWGYAGADWAMDPDVVNNPLYSGTIKDDLKAVPTVSLVMPWSDWFGGAGVGLYPTASELERGTSMEFFTADGSQEFQVDGGIEVQGGTSDDRWKTDKLSLRVKFKAPYGPEKLNADIFNLPIIDDEATAEFNTLVLDAQINYTWAYGGGLAPTDQRGRAMFIQDQVVADMQNLMGGQAPHGRFAHLYINGLYWGLYNVHERADEHFAESYLGGNDEDYDVLKHTATTVVSGDATAAANYDAMLGLVRQDMSVLANYQAAAAKIDVNDLADYMALNYYAGNDDWAHHNWYATYNRVDPNGKWRYHSWDAEHTFKDLNYNAIQTGDSAGSPEEVHLLLMANEEYRLRFSDQVQKHMTQNGVLSPAGAAAAYQTRMTEVDRAIVGESARWGDSHTTAAEAPGAGGAYTRAHWLARQNDLLSNYFPNRTGVVLGQFAARSWLAALAPPTFTNYGGTVVAGTQVTIAKPAGSPATATLYYTVDGSDPRLVGGGIAPGAIPVPAGSTTLTINVGTHVRARVFDAAQAATANDWSAEIDATFLLDTPFPLRITEINYNPAPLAGVTDVNTSQNLEFIELTNTGPATISLDNVQITEFSTAGYTFAPGLTLAPGARILVARSPATITQAYGAGVNVAAAGYFDQNLSNSGETIKLLGPLGEELQSITYSDRGTWPTSPDGGGKSLEIINPLGDPSSPTNWRVSYYAGGSPGTEGVAPAVAADFDSDGRVTGNDFLAWQRGLGTPKLQGSAAKGDADGDRDVDAADLAAWRVNYGAPFVAAASIAAVSDDTDEPEQVKSSSLAQAEPLALTANYVGVAQASAAFSALTIRSVRPAYRPNQVFLPLPMGEGRGEGAYRAALHVASVSSNQLSATDDLFDELGNDDDPASLAAAIIGSELASAL